jgi:hypothetical protein
MGAPVKYSNDWRGLLICRYNGAPKFAWARFSSEELALRWFCRMRIGVAVCHVPMVLVVYYRGKIHRQYGDLKVLGYGGG